MGYLCNKFQVWCDPLDYELAVVLGTSNEDPDKSVVYLGKDNEGVLAELDSAELNEAIQSGQVVNLPLTSLSEAGQRAYANNIAQEAAGVYIRGYSTIQDIARLNNQDVSGLADTFNSLRFDRISADDLPRLREGLMDVGNTVGYEYSVKSHLDSWAGARYDDAERQAYIDGLERTGEQVSATLRRVDVATGLAEYASDLKEDLANIGTLNEEQKANILNVLESEGQTVAPQAPVPR